jgi:hypothetical protein
MSGGYSLKQSYATQTKDLCENETLNFYKKMILLRDKRDSEWSGIQERKEEINVNQKKRDERRRGKRWAK